MAILCFNILIIMIPNPLNGLQLTIVQNSTVQLLPHLCIDRSLFLIDTTVGVADVSINRMIFIIMIAVTNNISNKRTRDDWFLGMILKMFVMLLLLLMLLVMVLLLLWLLLLLMLLILLLLLFIRLLWLLLLLLIYGLYLLMLFLLILILSITILLS